jgi:TorA maturation chaperone TorD
MSLALLSHLWLHEPDAAIITRAVSELGLPPGPPAELASAYTDVFLLNVYPYGTAFTDPTGELNGPEAQRVAALYEAHGYGPPELDAVGAPDHLGVCLGFAADVGRGSILPGLLEWAPVCCLAVEREPSAHPFYRALAGRTSEWLMTARRQPSADALPSAPGDLPFAEDEIRLRDIVRFFLIPARCGVFLSRSRWGQMARGLGMRLPFGSRFEVAEMTFRSAGGEPERLGRLLNALEAEVEAWADAYRALAEGYPVWRPGADKWLARTAVALRTLTEMRQMAAAMP